jgi:hypothetical protein
MEYQRERIVTGTKEKKDVKPMAGLLGASY